MKHRKPFAEPPPTEEIPVEEEKPKFAPPVGAGLRTEPTVMVEILLPIIVHGDSRKVGDIVEVGGNEASIIIGSGHAKEAEEGAVETPIEPEGGGEGEGGAPGAPTNKDIPYVSGTGAVGTALSCTMGNWEGEPTSYAYAWKSDGTTDAGTGSTYTVKPADKGHKFTCIVTATNADGSTAAPPSNEVLIP